MKFGGAGVCTGPAGIQSVLTQLIVTVPVGVTVHDWAALPPEEEVALAVKLLETRDSAAVGIHEMFEPLSVAPAGPVVNEKVTVPPEGSVAVREYA